jgi:hypothetical protein
MVQPYKAGGTHQGAVERGGASGVGEPAARVGSSRSRWGLGQSGEAAMPPRGTWILLKFVTVPSFVDSVYRWTFGPPGPALARAQPGPLLAVSCLARPNMKSGRASPRALPAAQARARGPVSCRASPLEPGTTAQAGPPEAHSLKYISP